MLPKGKRVRVPGAGPALPVWVLIGRSVGGPTSLEPPRSQRPFPAREPGRGLTVATLQVLPQKAAQRESERGETRREEINMNPSRTLPTPSHYAAGRS